MGTVARLLYDDARCCYWYMIDYTGRCGRMLSTGNRAVGAVEVAFG